MALEIEIIKPVWLQLQIQIYTSSKDSHTSYMETESKGIEGKLFINHYITFHCVFLVDLQRSEKFLKINKVTGNF